MDFTARLHLMHHRLAERRRSSSAEGELGVAGKPAADAPRRD